MIKIDSPGICRHCFADKALHKFETMNCPKNPRFEDNLFRETTFENADWAKLADAAQDMLLVLQQCLTLVADLNGSHFIPGKGDGNLDMIQRIKAMQPRIYNLIKPLQK